MIGRSVLKKLLKEEERSARFHKIPKSALLVLKNSAVWVLLIYMDGVVSEEGRLHFFAQLPYL